MLDSFIYPPRHRTALIPRSRRLHLPLTHPVERIGDGVAALTFD